MSQHRAHYFDARAGRSAEHASLVSDPIPEFIYKKMERRWALKFAQGSVKLGSLFYYRTIKDDSGTIVDPHEGLEECEVTEELAGSPTLAMIARGNLPPADPDCAPKIIGGLYFVPRRRQVSSPKRYPASTILGFKSRQGLPSR